MFPMQKFNVRNFWYKVSKWPNFIDNVVIRTGLGHNVSVVTPGILVKFENMSVNSRQKM